MNESTHSKGSDAHSAAPAHDEWVKKARALLDGLREAEAAADDLGLPIADEIEPLRVWADNYVRGVPS